MAYFAEIDDTGTVTRVIVADTEQWCVDNLGGTWVETADPYDSRTQVRKYPGPGWGHASADPQRFAPKYVHRDVLGDGEVEDLDAKVWSEGSIARVRDLPTRVRPPRTGEQIRPR